ncbi:MAG TPA: alternative ribosome rescue aminoacyl-tRNA hydrolase ArfB [Candidatus Sulfotelmatobacter sp.]|nr:alternative ribosome rescue aminoacyl-tRNA hydrolase ArfB [Candidatus Sulfotelmatobacter sp.]
MWEEAEIRVNDRVAIPRGEVRFRFTPSGGPGGQHANRSATQVELLFDVGRSPSLTDQERARVGAALKGYIDGGGILHLVSQATRSQYRNREDVLLRFQRLLRGALRVPKARRPTRPTAGARRARLEGKRRRAEVKRARRRPPAAE